MTSTLDWDGLRNPMLNYRRNRLDYGEQLMPPAGYQLTKAIAATYSLDLQTLLSIPIALFYRQTLEGGGEEGERVQLLDAIQRCPDQLRIYHQAGKIHVPRRHNRLYGLLEPCVVGILPADVHESFHPKVWILRFDLPQHPPRYRVIVLSRNLTQDRSWDLAATLEGEVADSPQERNTPLVEFVDYLRRWEEFEGAEGFVHDLRRARFSPPRGFSGDFRFHPIGMSLGGNPLARQRGERLLCISPFTQDATIAQLRGNVSGECWLLGRKEELRRLTPTTLAGFRTYTLSDLVVDGEALSLAEDGDRETLAQSLHAKLFVYQRSERSARWFLGSANATTAAFQRNVELLLELNGTHDSVQLDRVLDDLLGPAREGGVFEPFVPSSAPEVDSEQDLEQQVRRLEHALLNAFQGATARLVSSENGSNYDLHLELPTATLRWNGLEVMLVPFNSTETPQRLPKDDVATLCFQNINESNISRFLRVEILHQGESQRSFLVKIEIEGVPPGRNGAIIRGLIHNQEKFFEYLQFLLSEAPDKEALLGSGDRMSGLATAAEDGWTQFHAPLFERLLVTASRHPRRLKEVDQLIQILRDERGPNAKEIVPQDFLEFWCSFREMVPEGVEANA